MTIAILILCAVILAIAAAIYLRGAGSAEGQEARHKDLMAAQERLERALRDETARNRGELLDSLTKVSGLQKDQLETFSRQLRDLTQLNDKRLEELRRSVEERLKTLQEDNTKKLDKMRETVDEKLSATLEKRLGESFKQVSDRLEAVHKGLGEMHSLASSVGDLKKVLTNVKTRGTLGEIQLKNILDELLTPEQYIENAATKKGSSERVEFAVKMPGRSGDGTEILLPIDSKFPTEDYQLLRDAQERGDAEAAEKAAKALEVRIKAEARDIRDKYLNPPATTDFGVMFLPVEGLYAEVLRRPGLFESLQREFRVLVTGPTTLSAILNSLQMGFRTLAIEKRSSEVWALLGAVKSEFGKFADILAKTHKKLQEASNTIETAEKKTRTIATKLRKVQELPAGQGQALLSEDPGEESEAAEEEEGAA